MEWIKFDLHHHTNEDYARENNSFDYEMILEKFNQEKVKLIAITNHNNISIKSIKEYKKIIKRKNYDINLVPGIEIQFKMGGSTKLGHLVLIFSDIYNDKIEELNSFFMDQKNYDPNSNENFNDAFPKMLNKLVLSNFNDFIIMPHFDKTSNKIDFETINGDLKPWLYSFDILEGTKINQNAIDRITKSLNYVNPDIKKPIYVGTDAQNTDECLRRIVEIPFFLTEPTYEGLKSVVHFPETRISDSNSKNPAILKNYIKSIKIGKDEIFLEQGLNTIIGRRGSGKSYLLNSIIKKVQPNSSFDIKNFDNEIEIIGDIDNSKIITFKQSEIAQSLTNFINDIAQEVIQDFDLIKHIFGNEFNRRDFTSPITNFKKSQELLKNNLKNILNYSLEIEQNNSQKAVENYEFIVYEKFQEYSKLMNKELKILKINSDLNLITKLIDNKNNTKWLQNEFLKIKRKLELLLKTHKNPNEKKIKEVILLTEEIKNNLNFKDQNSNNIYKMENSLSIIKNVNINKEFEQINEFIDKIKNFISSVKENSNFIVKDIKVSDKNDFLTFDSRISKIVFEYNELSEIINKFIFFNLDRHYNQKQKSTSKKVIEETMISIETIPKINGEDITNNSVGEKHEKFMENILDITNAEIIILDQPDDDLDALTIEESLISKFKNNFYLKQWIIVTHDPKIIVNSDSKKIILSNYNNSSTTKYKNTYLNINLNDIKNEIYKILDSKKEYPKIRGTRYGE